MALVASILTASIVLDQDEASAATAFTPVFSTNAPGDITYVSNTLITCSETGTNGGRCVSRGQQGNWANNNFTMRYVDIDGDGSTTNSSSNDLTLNSGANVLFAGLFWVGYADDDRVFDPTIQLDTPAAGGYTTVTAAHLDSSGSRHYGAYADVTALVQAGGNGTYMVGGADLDAAASGRYGGWTLAVAYEDNAEPWRNLSIFNGFDFVSRSNSPVPYQIDLTVAGFTAPPVGPVSASLGTQTGEGDARYAGPSTAVNTVLLSDGMNPSNNVQNSTISILGNPANVLANPSYSNQLGFDADIMDATGLIPAGATSADLRFRSTGDVYSINLVSTAIDIYVPNITTNLVKAATDVNGEELHPGDVIDYSISFDNVGEDPAAGAVITDIIPTGTTYVPGSLRIVQSSGPTGPMSDAVGDDAAFFDSGTNTATFHMGAGATAASGGEVVPLTLGGQVHEAAFQVTVDPGTENTEVTNSATIEYVAEFINESYTVTTNETEDEVLPLVDLSIEKVDDVDPVIAGNNVTYTVTVDNAGPSPADNVVVTDTLPGGTSVVSAPGCTVSGPTLTCTTATIAAGDDWSFPIEVAVSGETAGSSLTNVASVTSDTHEHDVADNGTKEPTALHREADLAVDKSAPTTIAAGETLTYTVAVENLGDSDALNVELSDPIPSGTSYSSVSADLGGVCTAAVSCSWPVLAAGATATVTIEVTVPSSTADGTVINNKTRVRSTDPDPVSANNTDAVSTTVRAEADLVISKSAPATATAGDQITYTLDVTNDGPSNALNVQLSDPVPAAGFTYNPVASSSGCSLSGATVTCDAGTVAAGASASFTVVFDLDSSMADGATVTNEATASSDTDDPDLANNNTSVDSEIERRADLAIRKDDNTVVALGGGQILYSLDYANSGPSDASSVVITDTLAADVTFNAGLSDPACSVSGSIVTCTVGPVVDGGTGSLDLVVDVSATVVDGAALHNEATVAAAETDPDTNNNATSVDTPAERSAELELSKVDDVDPVVAGNNLGYTLSVRNIGPSADDNIVLTDTLPAGVTFVSADPGCSHLSGVVTCNVGTLLPGGVESFEVSVATDAGLANGLLLTNQLEGSGDASPLVAITEETTVVTQADVGMAKAGPATVVAGTSATYTLTVSNAGPSNAANIVVSDAFPTGTTYQAHSVTQGAGTCSATSSNLSCEQATLAPGDTFVIELTLEVAATLADAATITNTALVKADTSDLNSANNSDEHNTAVDRSADMSITKSALTPTTAAGRSAQYQLVVTNNGPSQATDVVVSDTLPTGFTLDAAGSTGCAVGVLCTVPTALNPGDTFTFTVVADVDPAVDDGVVANTASVAAAEDDAVDTNDSASADVEVITEADLVVSKISDQTTFTPGTPHTYTLTVTNNGPSDAANVVVADTLPAGLTFDALAASDACVNGVTCSVDTLAADSSVSWTVAVNVDPAATGTLTNEVSVSADTSDPDPVNNDDEDPTLLIPLADLIVEKSAADTVVAGDSMTYSITTTNDGPSVATNVRTVDTLPTGVVFVSGPPACAESSGTVTCTETSLAPGGVATYTFTVAVDAVVADGAVLVNEVIVESDVGDPDVSNNASEAETTVSRVANLVMDKSVSATTVTAGTSLTYSIAVTNEGPSSAASVIVSDALPAGADASSVATTRGSCLNLGDAVSCSLSELPAGATMTVTIVVEIDPATGDGTILTNDANATTDTIETDTTDNADSVDVRVTTSADLSVEKDSGIALVTAGENISYTITVTNDGPSEAAGVVLADTVPGGLTVTGVSPAADCSAVGGAVSCEAGTLALDESFVLTIDAVVSEDAGHGDTLLNTATADSSTADPTAANNVATDATDVTKSADLAVSKSASVDAVSGGETLFYNLLVDNAGPSSATDIVVTDTLPAGVTYNAALSNSNCTESGGVVTCSFPRVAADGDLAFAVAVDLPPSFSDGTVLANTVTVEADEEDPDLSDNDDSDDTTVMNLADLSIVKDADELGIAGEAITWDLVVANDGPADALAVVVTDALPAGATFNSTGSDGRCSAAGSVVTCNLVALAAGGNDIFTIEVDLASSVADLELLANTADISSDTDDPDPDDNSGSDEVPVERDSELSIVKTDLADPVVAGETVTWSIVVSNAGPSDAGNVTISDSLPAGFTVASVSDTTNCSVAGTTVDCTFDAIADGESATVLITADVDASLADGSNHRNTAVASSDSSESVSDTEDTTVVRRSDLLMAKTSDGTVLAGTDQSFTLQVTNEGPSDAAAVSVTDVLPAAMTFVSDDLGVCSAVGAVVTCDLSTVAAGATTELELVVAVGDDAADPSVNAAVVDSDSQDPVPGNNTDDDSTDISYAADLSLTKTASPDPAVPGSDLTWTLTATNSGPSTANNVVVTDVLPTGTDVVSASAACSDAAGTVTCSQATLASGASVSFSITAALDSNLSDTITNTASVTSDTPDPNAANNAATLTTDLQPSADLAITKIASPDPVVAGESLTYTITVDNEGPSDAVGVVIADVVPDSLSVTSVSPSADCSQGGQTVSCTAGNLVAGSSYVVTITARLDQSAANGTFVANTATATSDTPDPRGGNNTATVETEVDKSADVSVLKSSAATTAAAGQSLVYSIEVSNAGPSSATGIEVVDMLPPGVVYNGALSSSACAEDTGIVTCNFLRLNAGNSFTFNIVVDLPSSMTDGATLSNAVAVDAAEDDPDSSNDDDLHELALSNEADLSIVKDADGFGVAGEAVEWNLTVHNAGDSDAANVIVTDTLPVGAGFDPVNSDSRCSLAGGVVTCNVGTVGAGLDENVVIVMDLDPSVADETNVPNTALVSSDTADPDPDDNSSSDSIPVKRASDISVVKYDLSDPVVAGTPVQWAITVANAGPSDADNVTISDPLPPGFTAVSLDDNINCSVLANTVDCTFATVVAGGEETVTVTAALDSSLADGSTHQNTVSADADSSDPVSDTEDTTAVRRSDLQILKSSDGEVVAGTNQTFTIDVTNNGPSDADNVVVTDVLPAGVSFVSDSLGACTAALSIVVCDLGAVADEQVTSFELVVYVDDEAGTSMSNNVVVDSDSEDPNPANNVDGAETDVSFDADLRIDKSTAGEAAMAGEQVTWTILVTNDGPSVANDVVITDVLPSGVSLVSTSGSCREDSGTITCPVSSMAVGDEVAFTIVADLSTGFTGDLVNTAEVDSETPDSDADDNESASRRPTISSADLALDKELVTDGPDDNGLAIAGRSLDFVITVTNAGPSDAVNVVVQDQLPIGMTFITGDPACSELDDAVVCSIERIEPGTVVTLPVEVLVDSATAAGTSLVNGAVVAADTDDPDQSNNTDSVGVEASRVSDLVIGKVSTQETVVAGEVADYEILVTNLGASDADNLVVTDVLAEGLTFDSFAAATAAEGACTHDAGVITCTYDVVAALGSAAMAYTAMVDPAHEAGKPIKNLASVTSDSSESVSGMDTLTVEARSELAVAKTTLTESPMIGDEVRWEVEVTNSGPSVATNVVIIDDVAPVFADVAADDPGCVTTGNSVRCSSAALGVGETWTIEVSSLASNEAFGERTNTVEASADNSEVVAAEARFSVDVPDVRLSVVKQAEGSVSANGDLVNWVITVDNSGEPTATPTVVTDEILPSQELVSTNAAAAECGSAGPVLTCEIPPGFSGSTEIEVVTRVVDISSGVANAATLNLVNGESLLSDSVEAQADVRSGVLAFTGSSTMTAVLLGSTLVLVGGAILGLSNRSRRRRTTA